MADHIMLGIADRGSDGQWLSQKERIANVVREVCAGLYTQDEAVALLNRLIDECVDEAGEDDD